MPVPGPDVQADPLMSVCFNAAWMPAVLTALKELTRPEVWIGSDADIKATIIDAHTLMGLVQDGCGAPPEGPNWYLDLTVNGGNYDVDVWNNPIFYVGPGGIPKAEYVAVIWNNGAITGDITIKGRAVSDNSLVGGRFDNLHLQSATDPAGAAFAMTVDECLGDTIVYSGFTPQNYSGDWLDLRFVAGADKAYMLHITIQDNWTCARV